MRIGLYFGSFNPIHNGHLIIASYVANHTELDEVWLVVSPQNPFKPAKGLLNEQHRLSLVKIAVEGEQKIKASNIEFKLPKPSYTIDTLIHLEDKYPTHNFSIIMGSDGFQNITKWKSAELIITYPIFIYQRPGFLISETIASNIKILNAPLLDISSTQIRKSIKDKKSIRYLVPDDVLKEIEEKGYYQSSLENES